MKEDIAKVLLQVKAVALNPKNPFTFVSGIKSPIYCDNRVLISYPQERNKIIRAFMNLIEQSSLKFDVIAGTATAGIPWASWLADKLNKPLIYIRSEAKGHGKGKRIEGLLNKNDKVLVIEDLISTGGSSVSAIQAVREEGGFVVSCIAIFTYGMDKSVKAFSDAECKLLTLSDFATLVSVAVKEGYMSSDDQNKVLEWNKNPSGWKVL